MQNTTESSERHRRKERGALTMVEGCARCLQSQINKGGEKRRLVELILVQYNSCAAGLI